MGLAVRSKWAIANLDRETRSPGPIALISLYLLISCWEFYFHVCRNVNITARRGNIYSQEQTDGNTVHVLTQESPFVRVQDRAVTKDIHPIDCQKDSRLRGYIQVVGGVVVVVNPVLLFICCDLSYKPRPDVNPGYGKSNSESLKMLQVSTFTTIKESIEFCCTVFQGRRWTNCRKLWSMVCATFELNQSSSRLRLLPRR